MRVAITGSGGRLGSALVPALGRDVAIPWTRRDFDLDAPRSIQRIIERDGPDVVVHAAAWTDVDGCARDPQLALRRNGKATGQLAAACSAAGVDLVVVSTNEVFDGLRTDGRGYGPADPVAPLNAYGRSKLAGERAAADAYVKGSSELAIVRTAWLFGEPGGDFPDKIVRAADQARRAGTSLRLVADEFGNPTATRDLAAAIVALVRAGVPAGIHHVTNGGSASRATWAREILRLAGLAAVPTEDVPASTWLRASTPPLRAVLATTSLPEGLTLPTWEVATATYVTGLIELNPASVGAGG